MKKKIKKLVKKYPNDYDLGEAVRKIFIKYSKTNTSYHLPIRYIYSN